MSRAGIEHPNSTTGLPGSAATAGEATVTFPVAVRPAVVAGLAGVPFGRQMLLDPGTISHCKRRKKRKKRNKRRKRKKKKKRTHQSTKKRGRSQGRTRKVSKQPPSY